MRHDAAIVLFDLEGRLRKTSVPTSRPLLPVFEAVANLVHEIQEADRRDGLTIVELRRGPTLDEQGKGPIDSVVIRDNGVGFTQPNYTAFETADTTYELASAGRAPADSLGWWPLKMLLWKVATIRTLLGGRSVSLRGPAWRPLPITIQNCFRQSGLPSR